jgi:hypothetical protein
MKKSQENNKYPKIRLILSVSLFLLMVYHCLQFLATLSIFTDVSYLNFLPILLIIIGTILFTLNRKQTDYISFSTFIFLIGGMLPFVFIECTKLLSYADCVENYFFRSENLITILLVCSSLIYLIINFIKNIGKE